MANGGWYGTKEEWERIERQLLEIDPIITGFAGDYGLNVTKNHEGCPERSML